MAQVWTLVLWPHCADKSGQLTKDEAEALLTRCRARQVDLDPGLHLEDHDGDLDQLVVQGISNWPTRQVDRFGARARSDHIGQ